MLRYFSMLRGRKILILMLKQMNSKEYEQLINGISQDLTNDTRLRNFGHKQFGKNNRWEGASGFSHQIDASIHNESDALLIECKSWKFKVRAIEFLTLLGRLIDIRGNPKYRNLVIRGAIGTTRGWQSGAEKLVKHYSELCSVFVVKEDKTIADMIHEHFIKPISILSGERFGHPTIKQS